MVLLFAGILGVILLACLVAGLAMIAGMVIGFVQAIQDWRAGRPIGVEPVRSVVNSVPVAAEVRARVMARDGFACVYCGAQSDLTVDHLVSRAAGGSNLPENLVAACRSCNARMGTHGYKPVPIPSHRWLWTAERTARHMSRNGHH